MTGPSVRVIAFYLPQFHPIAENDEWWGKGFTEWTYAAKAKPLFRGHYQPHLPADLGFYDLRLPETRLAQARMARDYGIEGFCYYHYWFAGKRILERPFHEVLCLNEPDLPFCLCWANQTWTGIWHGAPNRVLIEQTYPGVADHERHFEALLPAFRDPRYIRVEDRPLFLFFVPYEIPDAPAVMQRWRDMAKRAGFPGLYLVGNAVGSQTPHELGLDASAICQLPSLRPWVSRRRHPVAWLKRRYQQFAAHPHVYRYEEVLNDLLPPDIPGTVNYPCLIPNWDNTPRSGANGLVLHESTPELFRIHAQQALKRVRDRDAKHRIVFVKSWNEWGEGNHLEPDQRFGYGYLEVVREVFGAAMTKPDRSVTARSRF